MESGAKVFMLMFGALLAIAGGYGWLKINSRRFYRRNQAGIEEFRSYSNMLFTVILERCFKGISVIACFGGLSMILFGLFAPSPDEMTNSNKLPHKTQQSTSVIK